MSNGDVVSLSSLHERWIASENDRYAVLAEAVRVPGIADRLLGEARERLHSQPAEAFHYAEFAARVLERTQRYVECAGAYRICGQLLRAMGRHEQAVAVLETAAQVAQAGKDLHLAVTVQIGAIDSLSLIGRNEEALALADRLEADLHALGDLQGTAKVLLNRGGVYFRTDAYHRAWECYRQALELFERNGEVEFVAQTRTNIANALIYLNRIEEAMEEFERSRRYFEEKSATLNAAVVDVNLAYWHHISGQLVQAVEAAGRAFKVLHENDHLMDAALARVARAGSYHELNLLGEALDDYTGAADVLRSLGSSFDLARAELGRASTLHALGRSAEVSEPLDRATELFCAQRNRVREAQADLLRGHVLRSQARTEEALEAVARAERVFARRGLPGWAAEARLLLTADATDDRARARLIAIRTTARRLNNGWLECRAEQALGRWYLHAGDRKRALDRFRDAVSALEAVRTLVAPEELHVSFLSDKLGVYQDLIALLLEGEDASEIKEALEYVERSRSRTLLERMQEALEVRLAAAQSSAGQGAEYRARLASLRAELSRGYYAAQTVDEEEDTRLTSVRVTPEELRNKERAYREMLRELEMTAAASTGQRSGGVDAVTVESLQAALDPDETLVEYYFAGTSLYAFIVSRDDIVVRRCRATRETISIAARRLRFQMQRAAAAQRVTGRTGDSLQSSVVSILADLYDLILCPIEQDLKGTKIVLVPHELLHGLPFHLFFDGEQYALDRWEFLYTPSAAVWNSEPKQQPEVDAPKSSALLMGIPAPGIEQVADEVKALAALLPESELFTDQQATLEAFRSAASRHRVIHLATHAQYRADNPLFSGLRFYDDWLLASDLYEMALDCDLATLSACHTGVNQVEPGDELFGLVRGFLIAGCRTVAASLWPADDAATAQLMVRFYNHLCNSVPAAAALRMSQQEIRTDYPHPYHWGAFAVIGSRASRFTLSRSL